jgi:peroxiredoxin
LSFAVVAAAPDVQGKHRTNYTRIGIMKIRNIAAGLLLTIVGAGSLASSGLTGLPAPDFALKSSSGENLRLSEYRGDVVMINFWATWCGPCRQEMPLLDELYSRYQRVGFSLLGVNIDDDSGRAMDMIDELGVTFPVLFDSRKEVSRLYEVDAMPVTVLVGREGNVRHIHHGYKPGYEQKYLNEIRALLRE